MKPKPNKKWALIITLLVVLAIFSFIIASAVSLFVGVEAPLTGNVALIPINGVILTEKTTQMFGEETASSSTIMGFIKKADENPSIKAIIFEINSPGGSAVASEEIANAVKRTNKTTVALIREGGTSGAYWIASAADYIVANRMSITGSIGVIASYLEFSGLLKDYNVTYQRLVSGEYKDIGIPFKEMTKDEKKLFQGKLDKIHQYFIEAVAENRKLPKETVNALSTGIFYLGSEAKETGLVDILGGKEEVIELIEDKLNITVEISEYREKRTLLDVLSSVFSEQSFFVGKGIGSSMFDRKAASRVDVWT